MEFIKKYKNFFSDVILNMIGFGIYIVAQQIFLLPILAKLVNDDIYSNIVLYISILNVICNTTGGELGNVRLVRDSEYKNKNIIGFCFVTCNNFSNYSNYSFSSSNISKLYSMGKFNISYNYFNGKC